MTWRWHAARVYSLEQTTEVFFEVGGQYRSTTLGVVMISEHELLRQAARDPADAKIAPAAADVIMARHLLESYA